MIIGVDCGALSITDDRLKVGVWRVTDNLLKALARIDTKNEYRLYTFAPINKPYGHNFKNIVVRPRFGWSRISLPIELRRHPVDVFLGLSQMLPMTSAKKIGFIYDLAFKKFPDAYPGSYDKLVRQTRDVIDRADIIITISETSKKEIDRDNVVVAYPGVDPLFKKTGLKYTQTKPYVLMVGSLKRLKNIPLATEIVKKTPYELILVGGDYWKDTAIPDNVKKIGYVSDEKLAMYYRGAHALLVTSLWEGFCLPAVEAIACGCPVVYNRAGALDEIIGDKGIGFTTVDEAVIALSKPKKPAGRCLFTWQRFAREVYTHL